MFDFFNDLFIGVIEENGDEIINGFKYIAKKVALNFVADKLYKKVKNHSNANKSGSDN